MTLSRKNVEIIKNWVIEEEGKLITAKNEITECAYLNIINPQTHHDMIAHLDIKQDHLRAMYDALNKYNGIYNPIVIAGFMGRRKPHAPEMMTGEEKKLIEEAYEATQHLLVYKEEEKEKEDEYDE